MLAGGFVSCAPDEVFAVEVVSATGCQEVRDSRPCVDEDWASKERDLSLAIDDSTF